MNYCIIHALSVHFVWLYLVLVEPWIREAIITGRYVQVSFIPAITNDIRI